MDQTGQDIAAQQIGPQEMLRRRRGQTVCRGAQGGGIIRVFASDGLNTSWADVTGLRIG